jgi:hypothetical protein
LCRYASGRFNHNNYHSMKKKSASQSAFFKLRTLLGVLLGFAGVTIVLFALGKASAQPSTPSGQANPPTGGFAAANKIASEVLADTADGRSASVIILLADQADVNAGYGIRDQDAQGWFVYDSLTQHAARTQIGLKNFLSSRGNLPVVLGGQHVGRYGRQRGGRGPRCSS